MEGEENRTGEKCGMEASSKDEGDGLVELDRVSAGEVASRELGSKGDGLIFLGVETENGSEFEQDEDGGGRATDSPGGRKNGR